MPRWLVVLLVAQAIYVFVARYCAFKIAMGFATNYCNCGDMQ